MNGTGKGLSAPNAPKRPIELTEEMIAAAMAKADARVCAGADRCSAFPNRLHEACPTCTPKGRCNVGWVVRASGRESWGVWLEVITGLVKLIARTNACAGNGSPSSAY